MSERVPKEKNKKFSAKKIPWRTLILFAMLIYAAITFIDQEKQLNAADARHAELLKQEAAAQEELDYLERKENMIETDKYVEQSVRERLSWIGEDEMLFYAGEIIEAEPTATPQATE